MCVSSSHASRLAGEYHIQIQYILPIDLQVNKSGTPTSFNFCFKFEMQYHRISRSSICRFSSDLTSYLKFTINVTHFTLQNMIFTSQQFCAQSLIMRCDSRRFKGFCLKINKITAFCLNFPEWKICLKTSFAIIYTRNYVNLPPCKPTFFPDLSYAVIYWIHVK
jgi:hypothetical protein